MKNKKDSNTIVVNWDKYAEQYDAVTQKKVNPAYHELVEFVTDFFIKQHSKELDKELIFADLGGGTGNFLENQGGGEIDWIEKTVPQDVGLFLHGY
jgi:hypothetical protein